MKNSNKPEVIDAYSVYCKSLKALGFNTEILSGFFKYVEEKKRQMRKIAESVEGGTTSPSPFVESGRTIHGFREITSNPRHDHYCLQLWDYTATSILEAHLRFFRHDQMAKSSHKKAMDELKGALLNLPFLKRDKNPLETILRMLSIWEKTLATARVERLLLGKNDYPAEIREVNKFLGLLKALLQNKKNLPTLNN